MVRAKKLIVGLFLVALGLWFAYWLKGYLEVDSCLDRGGRWNHEQSVCEYSEK